jgi:pimeloyl-ACP methyl ester carboxylesterase/nucleoside-diphosphate-sugar epimerase
MKTSENENEIEAEVLVTGATGLIGRWLLAELTKTRSVAALVRRAAERRSELCAFVDAHGGDSSRLLVVEGDVEQPSLGLTAGFERVRDVYHLAALFAFGLGADEARRCNVDGSLHVATWALARPALRRFVFLGGYRMMHSSVAGATEGPLPESEREALYREHGAYEASKHDAYRTIRSFAAERGLRWTAVHPSSVIGDSRTGETTQTTGIGATVEKLWEGRLPALVGTERTFLPLVTVDYLARFLASVPERAETLGQDLCVLDQATPKLPELVRRIAAHLGVPAPSRVLPLGLVRALPQAITGLAPESLRFLTEDAYDTTAADAHAAAMGLVQPAIDVAVQRWCDYLVATRFLAQPGDDRGTLREGAYHVGDPGTADVVYLHGLPWNGDAWKPVADRVGGSSARVDLPGLGRSTPSDLDDVAWLDRLLAQRTRPVVLVGHSRGAAMAVRYAHAHPGKVRGVVLVSPAFLQRAAPVYLKLRPLVALTLRRSTSADLARRLLPEHAGAPLGTSAVASARVDLQRKGVASRIARSLAQATSRRVRATLRRQLDELEPGVVLVHGSRDPLEIATDRVVYVVDGAGHAPHLTRTDEVAAIIAAFAPGPPS